MSCGDPAIAEVGATFSSATTKDGWFGMPDNCAVDSEGRLWIATDGNARCDTGRADGVWALETEGAARGTSKLFFRCPAGGELCGPMPTPDVETFFVAVQHPGDDGKPGRSSADVDFRRSVDPLARFQGRHAAAPVGRRDHQTGGGKIGV